MATEREEAPGELEHVRAFVNTAQLDQGSDELSSARALVKWLAGRGLIAASARAGRRDLEAALELREAIRTVLLANTTGSSIPPEAHAALNRAADRARLRPRVLADGSSAIVADAGGVDGALGRLLAIIHQSMADGSWPRLGVCRDEACQLAFYDHTKNRARTWCSMEVCGNRAKARAYRRRRDASTATDGPGGRDSLELTTR